MSTVRLKSLTMWKLAFVASIATSLTVGGVALQLKARADSASTLLPAAAVTLPNVSDLPGIKGLPVQDPNPPIVTLSAPNAPTSIANSVAYTETSPYVRVLGAHLTRSLDPAAAMPDSISPFSSNSFQSYSVEADTDAPKAEFQFRATGGSYRVWVDNKPISLAPIKDPGGGALYRLQINFGTQRAMHLLRFEVGSTRFAAFVVSKTDTLLPPPVPGERAVIIGDSYAEGTGAAARFTTFGQTFCELAGWADCWVAGSGGTGYLNPGLSGLDRVTYRDRIVNDAIRWNPDVIMITGGRNDVGYATPAQEQAEATALFQQIKQALPNVQLIVTSIFPASGTEANSTAVQAMSSAIQSAAAGYADEYLDVMGKNAYITGTGNSGAPNGSGNADYLTSPDKVHPTQLGDDDLAEALYAQYTEQLHP